MCNFWSVCSYIGSTVNHSQRPVRQTCYINHRKGDVRCKTLCFNMYAKRHQCQHFATVSRFSTRGNSSRRQRAVFFFFFFQTSRERTFFFFSFFKKKREEQLFTAVIKQIRINTILNVTMLWCKVRKHWVFGFVFFFNVSMGTVYDHPFFINKLPPYSYGDDCFRNVAFFFL